ncbi:ATPase [Methanocaldococcus bathoardescens]|uniref:ATPase n=1 Tax=Methanocaldococcus bathoardescens TaxID=1301915 RepID=A0A076LGX6_9EURY|nr:ATP-binding protein [Methanocaldococcus bathoardescens]AIJ06112.1 ATPase [Methanocaldococcus bathoardescens]
MKFFNREREIYKILSIMEGEPNLIYFIYGSINSGKTALINEIINNRLDKDRYVVFYINLRGIFVSKYDDFIEVLFEVYDDDKKPIEVIKSLLKDFPTLFGIPAPKNTLEEILKKKTTKNVFRYITNVLMEIKKDGKQPILIIDELQKIGDMKINGYLIYELFNYFIDLTKELHLCHVFCLSSDSLFIERVYNEAMLEDRVDYILVDDFDKETALKFMDFLAKEILNKELSDEDKELIYSYVGGKPVLIIKVIDKLRYESLEDILDYMLKDAVQKLKYFLKELDYIKPKVAIGDEVIEIKKEDIIEALKLFKNNYEISDDDISEPVYVYLVKRNILFLNPIEGILKPQSYLVWNAIKRIL